MIFKWNAISRYQTLIAWGYVIADTRGEAEERLKGLKWYENPYVDIKIDSKCAILNDDGIFIGIDR